ncbi:hypothetical protein PGT21_031337 [Puccinia graminis f. sp. tritici]|uniref:Uncharacterized protein n=1 Tax=Puccinia graminis f. sp. tritici TaxID=56615 RepID=A0A5B0QJU6_PUCGR|nr:hypothetical protein PGT21_031337 [Puccinia graminis f. sp. tritici]
MLQGSGEATAAVERGARHTTADGPDGMSNAAKITTNHPEFVFQSQSHKNDFLIPSGSQASNSGQFSVLPITLKDQEALKEELFEELTKYISHWKEFDDQGKFDKIKLGKNSM